MKTRTTLFTILVSCALSFSPEPILATSVAPGASEGVPQTKKEKGKSKQRPKVKVPPGGSGESTAERERRLKRECKGRPNAGACAGFAS